MVFDTKPMVKIIFTMVAKTISMGEIISRTSAKTKTMGSIVSTKGSDIKTMVEDPNPISKETNPMVEDSKPMVYFPNPTIFAGKPMVFPSKAAGFGTPTICKSQNRFAMKQNKFACLCRKWPSQICHGLRVDPQVSINATASGCASYCRFKGRNPAHELLETITKMILYPDKYLRIASNPFRITARAF
jgi:hypothetical protein